MQSNNIPLAELLRPKTLDEYVGQRHIIAEDSAFRKIVDSGKLHSMIFWGPPGVGKTTLAHLLAEKTNKQFFSLSAINSGVKDIRQVIDEASKDLSQPILFIDEIHRFSKSQQDSLLAAVEKGIVILIGATTENPSFEVISPLLSRARVYILKELNKDELLEILDRSLTFINKNLEMPIKLSQYEALLQISGGDARKLINAVEIVANTLILSGESEITNENSSKILQQNLAKYDKAGEMHYDIISAFIKSMRGSDPNAAVYWLARMVDAGEDPLFIARRMLILASEDIGNANPNAFVIANSCFDAVKKIGFPESRIILSQTAIYLACSPKSNASYMAIEKALQYVKSKGDLPVPLNLRNAPTKLMKDIGYGQGYMYAHDYDNNFVNTEFLPENISGTQFYNPGKNRKEEEFRTKLKQNWKNKYNY